MPSSVTTSDQTVFGSSRAARCSLEKSFMSRMARVSFIRAVDEIAFRVVDRGRLDETVPPLGFPGFQMPVATPDHPHGYEAEQLLRRRGTEGTPIFLRFVFGHQTAVIAAGVPEGECVSLRAQCVQGGDHGVAGAADGQ